MPQQNWDRLVLAWGLMGDPISLSSRGVAGSSSSSNNNPSTIPPRVGRIHQARA